jgi:hypothetical protein
VVYSVTVSKLLTTVHTGENDLRHSKSRNTYSIGPRGATFAHWEFIAPDRELISVGYISPRAVSGQRNILQVVIRSGVLLSYFG